MKTVVLAEKRAVPSSIKSLLPAQQQNHAALPGKGGLTKRLGNVGPAAPNDSKPRLGVGYL